MGDALPGFGDRLKRLRGELSQEQLANKIGGTASDVSRWERGVTLPRAETIRALCLYFRVSADYLLGLRDQPPAETPAFVKFRATRWGKIAEENGWIEELRAMRFPMDPTVDVYRDLVKSMLDVIESGDDAE